MDPPGADVVVDLPVRRVEPVVRILADSRRVLHRGVGYRVDHAAEVVVERDALAG